MTHTELSGEHAARIRRVMGVRQNEIGARKAGSIRHSSWPMSAERCTNLEAGRAQDGVAIEHALH